MSGPGDLFLHRARAGPVGKAADQASDSRIVHLSVGHWPQQDAPYRVNRLIKRWLEGVSKIQYK